MLLPLLVVVVLKVAAYRPTPTESAAERVARLYDRPECQSAILRAKRSRDWSKLSRKEAIPVRSATVNKYRIHFVRDYKVASLWYWENSIASVLRTNATAISDDVKRAVPFATPTNETGLYITFVRDPWTHLLAGYNEILHHAAHGGKGDFWRVSCDDEMGKVQRFKTFLEDLDKGTYLGQLTYHMFPMSLLISVVAPKNGKRFDFIGDLTTLDRAVDDLRSAVGLEEETQSPKDKMHSHDNDEGCNMNHFPTDPEIASRLCDLIEVDYVCFPDYAIPKVCLRLNPNYARG